MKILKIKIYSEKQGWQEHTFNSANITDLNLINGSENGSLQQVIFEDNAKNPKATGLGAIAFGGFRGDKPAETPSALPDNINSAIDDTTSLAAGIQSFVFGAGNRVYGNWSMSGGKDNRVYGKSSAAFGNGHQIGDPSLNAEYSFAFATGSGNQVIGVYSAAIGQANIINGYNCFATGNGNNIDSVAQYSSTFGRSNIIGASNSFALGQHNTISGSNSFAQGTGNKIIASYSTAFGSDNQVSGEYSVAIGQLNENGGKWSLVSGSGNLIDSNVQRSAAVGYGNKIYGSASVAFGYGNRITSPNCLMVGFGGVSDENYAEDPGNLHFAINHEYYDGATGTYKYRRALEVNNKGKVKVTNAPTEATDVVRLADIEKLNALINKLTDAQISALNDFAKTL